MLTISWGRYLKEEHTEMDPVPGEDSQPSDSPVQLWIASTSFASELSFLVSRSSSTRFATISYAQVSCAFRGLAQCNRP